MLKAGVIGAGHLGKIHIRLLMESDQYEFVGFHDSNPTRAKEIEKEFNCKNFEKVEDLIAACDMVDVVTPTTYHFKKAKKVIEAGKHLFIEKPITETVEEAKELLRLAEKHGVKGQVGQIGRASCRERV